MKLLKKLSQIMSNTTAYRLWQMPFVQAKLAPVMRHNDLTKVRSVLDVGCGPGTNCPFFRHTDYVGLDLNEDYITYARKRYQRDFLVQDVCQFEANPEQAFDFVLLNSLLHHLDDNQAKKVLQQLRKSVASDGHIHIVDLVLPERRSIARTLALNDRGNHPRPLADWRAMFVEHYQPVVFEAFPVTFLGVTLWSLVYFKGAPMI